MKFSILLLIIPAVFILNVDHSFAEDNSPVAPAVADQASPVAEPVAEPVTDAQPMNVETPVPSEPVPALMVPVEIVPVIENKEEAVTDSHLVIEAVEPQAVVADHASFIRMKQLAGRWEGAGNNGNGEKKDKIVVTYDVTAGGSAVLEKIFPGSDQEMITIYYEDKGQLALMHFSMIGTHSLMSLKPFPADMKEGPESTFYFGLSEGIGLDPEVDTHMHSLKISFIDDNHISQEWVMFEAGKPSGTYAFDLTRPPPSN
jgi:hypothetical protein